MDLDLFGGIRQILFKLLEAIEISFRRPVFKINDPGFAEPINVVLNPTDLFFA